MAVIYYFYNKNGVYNMFPNDFVCAEFTPADYHTQIPAPLFRKAVNLTKTDEAELIIGCAGFYDLFVNGKRATKGFLAPYISNPEQTLFYDRYELDSLLCSGENIIEIILGNGYRNPIGGEIWNHLNREDLFPAFALSFKCGDVSFTAVDMLWCHSHILFNDYRIGTYCDMRKKDEKKEWNAPKKCNAPKGKKQFATCEPIREIRRIKAKKITEGALRNYRMRDGFIGMINDTQSVIEPAPLSGGYIYDFGENNAGVPCLKIKGKRGQKIHLQFSELLYEGFVDCVNVDVYPDGCSQHDIYVCSGDGIEEYIPPFTYHGFRYCYVHGIEKEQLTPELLEYIVIHNDVKRKTYFSCSDKISNAIFDACIRSDESNLMYILTDCPQREKNGWTGDAAISAEHYMLNLEAGNCFNDWLDCMINAMDSDGRIPLMLPSSRGCDGCPVWDSALFFLPFSIYRHTGDLSFIKKNADLIMQNLRYWLSQRDERGICEVGYGDWLPVDSDADDYASPLGFCVSAVLMLVCKAGEIMFKAAGRPELSGECLSAQLELCRAIRDEYNDSGVITAGKTQKYRKTSYRPSQTSQALALYAGIFNEGETEKAVKTLIKLIEEKGNAFDTGFLGLRVIFRVLSAYGHSDLAYEMITRPEHPSYANMIYRGETTVWERFSPPGYRIGSHNHHFLADVSAWYVENILGIHVNPDNNNPRKILISPSFIEKIENAEGSYECEYGRVYVRWEKKNGEINATVCTSGDIDIKYDFKATEVNLTVQTVDAKNV